MGLETAPATVAAFAAALSTGFLGSLHCIGMCGAPIASALNRHGETAPALTVHRFPGRLAASAEGQSGVTLSGYRPAEPMPLIRASIAFNTGRILSYMIAGALVAGAASAVAGRVVVNDMTPLRLILFVFGQCLVIATGLYIAGFTKLLAPFERAGQWLWQRLQFWIAPRLQAHFATGPAQPFALGALWGWIPCGLVYGTLATAMASGSGTNGALIMFGFGLGTLPAMAMAGAAAAPLRRVSKMPRARLVAGSIVIALGVFGLSRLPHVADFAAFAQLCRDVL